MIVSLVIAAVTFLFGSYLIVAKLKEILLYDYSMLEDQQFGQETLVNLVKRLVAVVTGLTMTVVGLVLVVAVLAVFVVERLGL